ncbi:uncharacterized protein [Amphiura filiformis]|uniref:uncharacterized protein n=1 Tax=Amphiura filiformis TaxID=82378 RepID=UPI003B20E8C2
MSICFESLSDTVAVCDLTLYEYLVEQIKQNKKYRIRDYWRYRPNDNYVTFGVTTHIIKCECECLLSCTCTLGYREWRYLCITDSTNKTSSDLIVYEPTALGLSFANTSLNDIKSHAFADLNALKYLILDHNNIQVLPMTIFQNLSQLEVLNLGYNYLTYLTPGLFHSSVSLQYLDLSHNDIHVIHRDVFSLLHESFYLYLSYNNLTTLPDRIFMSLRKIDGTLDLSYNTLTSLPDGIFTSLQAIYGTLDLSYNTLTLLPDGLFISLQGIEGTLNLSYNTLTSLPDGIFTSLQKIYLGTIDLSHNILTSLPDGMFTSLQEIYYGTLDLSYNSLTSLPDGMFTSLQKIYGGTIDLSHNILTSLPDGIFTSLQEISYGTLDLSYNSLTSLPDGIFTSLQKIYLGTIDLSHNILTSLPDGIFTSLQEIVAGTLDLSNNKLTSLPDGIFTSRQIIYLGTLDLSHNTLTSLPDGMFTSLVDTNSCILDLSYNNLTTLPNRIFSMMGGLLALDLSHNDLVMLPGDMFSSMQEQDLLSLDLSHNKLVTLSDDCFKTLSKLKLLNLRSNQLMINSSLLFKSLSALKVLDISMNTLVPFSTNLFNSTVNLLSLDIFQNSLATIPSGALKTLSALIYLNISRNVLLTLPSFSTLVELTVLDLSDNKLQSFTSKTFHGLDNLQSLFLSNNQISELSKDAFYHLHELVFLNLSHNTIQEINSKAFQTKLETIDLRGNDMYRITHQSFNNFSNSTVILVDQYSSCCFIEDAQCIPQEPRPEYLTCNRMLPNVSIRVSIWVIGLFAFISNGIAYYLHSQKRHKNKVQKLLISQLSLSDLLMGINMLIIVIADLYYNEFFPSYALKWRQGFACKLAGFLSILSSEGSVFFITLISIDRLIAVKYPFGGHLLTTRMAQICTALAWLTAIFMSGLSIGLASEEGELFSISEVCIGIPIVRRHSAELKNDSIQINTTGFVPRIKLFVNRLEYIPTDIIVDQQQYEQNVTYTIAEITGSQISPIISIVIFIGVNLLCFMVVAACYIQIFRIARNASKKAARTQTHDDEIRMARKMAALVFTDFFCWVPLCITCILAQCNLIEIPPEAYVWIIGFILPINSSINPFLYVIYGEISDYWKKRKDARNARQQIEMQRR